MQVVVDPPLFINNLKIIYFYILNRFSLRSSYLLFPSSRLFSRLSSGHTLFTLHTHAHVRKFDIDMIQLCYIEVIRTRFSLSLFLSLSLSPFASRIKYIYTGSFANSLFVSLTLSMYTYACFFIYICNVPAYVCLYSLVRTLFLGYPFYLGLSLSLSLSLSLWQHDPSASRA